MQIITCARIALVAALGLSLFVEGGFLWSIGLTLENMAKAAIFAAIEFAITFAGILGLLLLVYLRRAGAE